MTGIMRRWLSHARGVLSALRLLILGRSRATDRAYREDLRADAASPEADGRPPTLPPAPYRSGLWGRIPSRDPDGS